jgi:phospho-N-acetylmuramoyl-pentapeptide-transferase
MTDILKTSLEALFITTFVSIIFAPIMISILYKFNQVSGIKKSKIGAGEGDNTLFMRIMNTTLTNGTPNMGGILIWVVVPALVALLVPITPVVKVFLLGFVLFGFWGFIDVAIFTNSFKHNEKIKAFQETFEWRLGKLTFSILLNIGVMYLLYRTGTFTSLSIMDFFVINITPVVLILVGIIGQFAIYSAELTDGADGLMIGIFTAINISLIFLLVIQGQYDFVPILAIILGVQIVDLYFNIPPARFWNGGPGAMPLGFTMFFVALVTNNIIPYFVISSITWLIMASSAIQILSLKIFKKRVFKIAPIHHHFQANGWPQYKVTMRFWLFTLFACILGIYIGLL